MSEQVEGLLEGSGEYHSLYVRGDEADSPALVLLHGSNGDERELLGFAGAVAPGASLLAVRGDVAMRPGHAFFRRFADRRIDVEDLRVRAARLAQFLATAGARCGGGAKPIAIGYSNGAIMATALLLDAPELLAGAVLLRPLLPFAPTPGNVIGGKPVLVLDGVDDQRRASGDGLLVGEALERAGAVVQRETSAGGHAIGPDDLSTVRAWSNRLRTS